MSECTCVFHVRTCERKRREYQKASCGFQAHRTLISITLNPETPAFVRQEVSLTPPLPLTSPLYHTLHSCPLPSSHLFLLPLHSTLILFTPLHSIPLFSSPLYSTPLLSILLTSLRFSPPQFNVLLSNPFHSTLLLYTTPFPSTIFIPHSLTLTHSHSLTHSLTYKLSHIHCHTCTH